MIDTTKSTDGEKMYKQCATEESARRQRQLEQSLLELMLSVGYDTVTIADICDRVGISRKTFYRYFSSKEGCLHALLDHAVIDGASYYVPNAGDGQSIDRIYHRFFLYWKEKRDLTEALMRNGLTPLLLEQMLAYTIREEGEFQMFLRVNSHDAHERNVFYLGGIMSLVLDWHRSGYQRSVPEMAGILSRLSR